MAATAALVFAPEPCAGSAVSSATLMTAGSAGSAAAVSSTCHRRASSGAPSSPAPAPPTLPPRRRASMSMADDSTTSFVSRCSPFTSHSCSSVRCARGVSLMRSSRSSALWMDTLKSERRRAECSMPRTKRATSSRGSSATAPLMACSVTRWCDVLSTVGDSRKLKGARGSSLRIRPLKSASATPTGRSAVSSTASSS